MRRLTDIMGGIVIGAGIFGICASLHEGGFSAIYSFVYVCAVLCGCLAITVNFS